MSVKADCDRLKQELSIANDKLSEFEIIIVQFSVCCMCQQLSLYSVGAATLDAVQLVLREERQAKEELLSSKQYIEMRSKEFIENQQRKLEKINLAKVR